MKLTRPIAHSLASVEACVLIIMHEGFFELGISNLW